MSTLTISTPASNAISPINNGIDSINTNTKSTEAINFGNLLNVKKESVIPRQSLEQDNAIRPPRASKNKNKTQDRQSEKLPEPLPSYVPVTTTQQNPLNSKKLAESSESPLAVKNPKSEPTPKPREVVEPAQPDQGAIDAKPITDRTPKPAEQIYPQDAKNTDETNIDIQASLASSLIIGTVTGSLNVPNQTNGPVTDTQTTITSVDQTNLSTMLGNLQSRLQTLKDSVLASYNGNTLTNDVTAVEVTDALTKLQQDIATFPQASLVSSLPNRDKELVAATAVPIEASLIAKQSTDDVNPVITTLPEQDGILLLDKMESALSEMKEKISQLKTALAQEVNPTQKTEVASVPTNLTDSVDVAKTPEITADLQANAIAKTQEPPSHLIAKNTNSNDQGLVSSSAFLAISNPVAASTAKDFNSNSSDQQQSPAQDIYLASTSSSAKQPTDTVSGFAKSLNKASSESLVQQVAYQVKTAVKDGSSQINIVLNPEELGTLEIKLHVKADGKTDVLITVDNRTTLDMLKNDASNLTKALSDAGLSANNNSLSFNLRDGQQQGQSGKTNPGFAYNGANNNEADEAARSWQAEKNYVVNLKRGLDIKI
jgi:flagellar hook-length control protein FliK